MPNVIQGVVLDLRNEWLQCGLGLYYCNILRTKIKYNGLYLCVPILRKIMVQV